MRLWHLIRLGVRVLVDQGSQAGALTALASGAMGFIKWLLAVTVAIPLMVGGACFAVYALTGDTGSIFYAVPAMLLGGGLWRVTTGSGIFDKP